MLLAGSIAPMPYLNRQGDVFVLYLGNEVRRDNENRFHPDWIDATHALLDEVEAHEGPAALVTTATGKFLHERPHTDWIFGNLDKLPGYLDRVHTVFSRLLAADLPDGDDRSRPCRVTPSVPARCSRCRRISASCAATAATTACPR